MAPDVPATWQTNECNPSLWFTTSPTSYSVAAVHTSVVKSVVDTGAPIIAIKTNGARSPVTGASIAPLGFRLPNDGFAPSLCPSICKTSIGCEALSVFPVSGMSYILVPATGTPVCAVSKNANTFMTFKLSLPFLLVKVLFRLLPMCFRLSGSLLFLKLSNQNHKATCGLKMLKPQGCKL